MLLVQLAQYLELVSARFRGHALGKFKWRMGDTPGLSFTPWCVAGMNPALQLRGPLVTVPVVSVITTNPGRLAFSVPSP